MGAILLNTEEKPNQVTWGISLKIKQIYKGGNYMKKKVGVKGKMGNADKQWMRK